MQFVEIDHFCQAVLRKNFPGVPIHDDIKTFKWDGDRPFLMTGGFPCQDISYAGKGAGIHGERSCLWEEYLRVILDIKPRFVIVENSPGLLTRGMGDVLRGLAEGRYDAEWQVLQAQDVGAPHRRERLFIVAYPHAEHGQAWLGNLQNGEGTIFPIRHRERPPFWSQAAYQFIGMDDGLSGRAYRNRGEALGNAIVPQVAYEIIEAIVEADA